MTRLRGWAPRGKRLVDKVPQGKWNTATFLAALRNDRIEAPCVFDGPINGERFHAYVEQFLVPTLKPNDIVILDNLGSHKGKAVRKAVKAAGARLLFLPKYSLDLNPIEQVFAKLKHLLRKAAARTLEAVVAAIRELLDAYTAPECANYFATAGYGQASCGQAPDLCLKLPVAEPSWGRFSQPAERPRCQLLRAPCTAIQTPSSLRSSNAQELRTLFRTTHARPLTMFCIK